MNPTTATLLKTIAELIVHAQAHPLDNTGIAKMRKARAAAEQAWMAAGSPDLPAFAPRPTIIPKATGVVDRGSESGDDKDWSPVRVLLEVQSLTEGGAALCSDGSKVSYAPIKLLWSPGSRTPLIDVGGLEEGTDVTVDIPKWLALEKGWE